MQQQEDEDTIDLGQLFLTVLHGWKTIIAVTLIGIGLAFMVYYAINTVRVGDSLGTVETAIQLYFDGIDKGQTPSGSTYDVTEIKSTEILQNAMEETGIKASTTQLAACMSAQGILSDETAKKIETIDTLTDEEIKMQESNSLTVNYTSYVIKLDVSKELGITKEQGRELLDEIVKQYRAWLIKKYYGDSLLGNTFAGDFSTEDYDFIQIADLMNGQLDDMTSYVQNNIKDGNFVSANNGSSRSSLLSMISSIKDNEVERMYTIIASQYVTKNVTKAVATYKNLSEEKTKESERSKSEANQLLKLIQSYAKKSDQTYVIGEGVTGDYTLNTQSTQYDDMVTQYINASTSASNAKEDAAYYASQATRFSGVTAVSGTDSKPAQELNTLIGTATEKLNQWTNIINETVSEYKANSTYKKYMEQLLPASDYTIEEQKGMAFYLAIGLAAGLVLGILFVLLRKGIQSALQEEKEQEMSALETETQERGDAE